MAHPLTGDAKNKILGDYQFIAGFKLSQAYVDPPSCARRCLDQNGEQRFITLIQNFVY